MPKINRIRIINFSYNNDAREIQDEMYSFYDGENALLNLSNGGGKSVLVQLILQPIIPDHKMQKRKMIEYFKKNTSPAFIMIEWLLDNPSVKDYLMTGIAIAPRSSMRSEESNKINYFTFASHYQQACDFDISYVPFAKRENDQLVLMPFERAREAVRKLVSAHREMFYYSRDDASQYRRILQDFGISQEEWKNLIARMNNDEGGIDELFERCSTSDSVFNEWIIKNIEKAILAQDSGETSIQDLLEGLVSDTIKNEEYIQAQKVINEYLRRHQEMEESLNHVCQSLDVVNQTEALLNQMHQSLKRKGAGQKAELEQIHDRQYELEEERSGIYKEKASEEYYLASDKLQEVKEQVAEEEANAREIKAQCSQVHFRYHCQRGAKLYGEWKVIQGAVSALRQKIAAEQGDADTRIRLDDLRYSLKYCLEKKQRELLDEIEQYKVRITVNGQRQKQLSADTREYDKKISQCDVRIGELRGFVTRFEKEEEQIFEKLGTVLLRNVLKELDKTSVNNLKKEQESQEKAKAEELKDGQDRLVRVKEQQRVTGPLIMEAVQKKISVVSHLTSLTEEQNRFASEYARCSELLDKYELSRELIYEKDALNEFFRKHTADLEQNRYLRQTERDQILDMIKGIRNKCVYLPQTLIQAIENQDITYQTGEAYLNNLTEDKREIQLKKNPMLPFSLVVKKQDISKIGQIPLKQCLLRQVVPVLSYEHLDTVMEQQHQLVQAGTQASFISSYEDEIFVDIQREKYLKDLEIQEERLKEQTVHISKELENVRKAWDDLNNFQYGKSYAEQLSKAVSADEQEIEKLSVQKKELEEKLKTLEAEWTSLEFNNRECEIILREINARKELLEKFLADDEQYQIHYRNLGDASAESMSLKEKREKAGQELENCRAEAERIKSILYEKNTLFDQTRESYRKYENAGEANLLDDPYEQMEQEYEQLLKNQKEALSSLEEMLRGKLQQLSTIEDALAEIEVDQKDYETLHYDRQELQRLKSEVSVLEAEKIKADRNLGNLRITFGKMETMLDYAAAALHNLGLTEPLEKSRILQDYDRRLKNLKSELDQLHEKEKAASRLGDICKSLVGRIQDIITVAYVPIGDFGLEEDMEAQFTKLKDSYRNARTTENQSRKACQNLYREIRRNYLGKNQCVTDILESLSTLNLDDEQIRFDIVYFYMEEFMKKRENLLKLSAFYDSQLENIARTRNQIIDQCISHAALIYDDVKLIAQSSKIRLTGKSRPVQMLRIDVPDELGSDMRGRMESYIDHSLQTMVELCKAGDGSQEKKWKDKLTALMSSRELLNQLIGTNKIPVYVYKIDLNDKNNGMKKWEDAMAQNSGGEKFVVFFTMVSTLISYIREVTRRDARANNMQESKVMIMDNPFARTSSEHLLKAVIDIAKTFNIQLICLSDLSQSSITNRFSLIYQLSIRKRMYSDRELLKVGNVQINKGGLHENERLEHVGLFQKFQQGSLWDWVDQNG